MCDSTIFKKTFLKKFKKTSNGYIDIYSPIAIHLFLSITTATQKKQIYFHFFKGAYTVLIDLISVFTYYFNFIWVLWLF